MAAEEIFMEIKKIKSVAIILIMVVIIIIVNPVSCVGATDRGIRYMFNKPSEDILLPGVHFRVPLAGSIKTWSIVPNKLAIDIPIDSAGAISKDNQIIGVQLVVYWQYDEENIYAIATRYSEQSIVSIHAPARGATL